MHIVKASCSYAAPAGLPACEGIDTEDRKIAPEIKPLWLFAKEEDSYLSAPIRQTCRHVYRI